jgi:hypothetical protein
VKDEHEQSDACFPTFLITSGVYVRLTTSVPNSYLNLCKPRVGASRKHKPHILLKGRKEGRPGGRKREKNKVQYDASEELFS